MSDARLVDKILKRKEANRKNLAWPVSVADLKSWLQEEPSSFHRQTFLNFLYPSAPDWLLIVCDNLNEFIPYLPKPLTYQTFTNLHLWTIYQIRNEDWRHHFWQQVPNWFAEPLELLNFLRHIPAECMHDALRRPGMGACLAKLTPSMRYEWIVDLFSANPERLFSIEAIIALLTDQTLADQKNILERLKDSYLKVRPLSLARLSQFLNVLHPELFALFREEFDALFCVFNAKQFVSGTENVLNFLTLLDTPKHQAFFELFRGDEIQWWIAGLPFTAASISKEQKQSLIGALINASAKYN